MLNSCFLFATDHHNESCLSPNREVFPPDILFTPLFTPTPLFGPSGSTTAVDRGRLRPRLGPFLTEELPRLRHQAPLRARGVRALMRKNGTPRPAEELRLLANPPSC